MHLELTAADSAIKTCTPSWVEAWHLAVFCCLFLTGAVCLLLGRLSRSLALSGLAFLASLAAGNCAFSSCHDR